MLGFGNFLGALRGLQVAHLGVGFGQRRFPAGNAALQLGHFQARDHGAGRDLLSFGDEYFLDESGHRGADLDVRYGPYQEGTACAVVNLPKHRRGRDPAQGGQPKRRAKEFLGKHRGKVLRERALQQPAQQQRTKTEHEAGTDYAPPRAEIPIHAENQH